jgi:anti-sigma-K factor RskA
VNNSNQIHDNLRQLVEAYALGSLDSEDRAALAAHLASGCDQCATALGEAQWVVSQLAYLAPEAGPSDMLRGRLLKTVREEAAAAKPQVPASAKPTIPLWIWGAVAAALLFAVYNAYEARSTQERIRQIQGDLTAQLELQEQTARELALAKREALILTDAHSVKIAMAAGNKELPVLEATWHQQLGIVVAGQKLPVPSGNHTLQLWLIPKSAGGKPIPSLTLRPDANGKFDLLVPAPPDALAATKALAITEEPDGGSPQPTTTPIWVGTVAGK